MTGQELYEEFKAALDYLGPGFHGMDEVQITIDGTKLRLSVDGRECAIDIPKATPNAELGKDVEDKLSKENDNKTA